MGILVYSKRADLRGNVVATILVAPGVLRLRGQQVLESAALGLLRHGPTQFLLYLYGTLSGLWYIVVLQAWVTAVLIVFDLELL